MEKLTFTIDGHSFSTAFNTAIDREHCIEEILSTTGKRYDWFREITGRKNWILYDTEQYEVKDFDSFELVVLDNRFDGVKEFLHVNQSIQVPAVFYLPALMLLNLTLQNSIHQKLLI